MFAGAILQLVRRTGATAVTDFGAGSGELLAQLAASAPDLALTGVEVRARPEGLAEDIAWVPELPDRVEGLLIANELLDNVPCQVVERTEDAWRVVEVQTDTGEERLGSAADDDEVAWLSRWWPSSAAGAADGAGQVGQRVEVGLARDLLWVDACSRVSTGTSLAIDYGHHADYRPILSTVRSYRGGRETSLSLDGHHDITAHVAIDSVAAAVGAETARSATCSTSWGSRRCGRTCPRPRPTRSATCTPCRWPPRPASSWPLLVSETCCGSCAGTRERLTGWVGSGR